MSAAPRPDPPSAWPRWRVVCAGICGTDRLLAGQDRASGQILGHEVVCADRQGQCYALNNEIPCGACRPCRDRQFSHCTRLLELGVNAPGGFAKELRAPAANLRRLRLRDPRLGILAEPLACALHGAERLAALLAGQPRPPRVLLVGAGVAGRLLALTLEQRLPEVPCSVHDPCGPAMAWARTAGLAALEAVPAEAFQATVECSGTAAGRETALRAVRPLGGVLLYGTPPGEPALDPRWLWDRELTVTTARAGCDRATFARAVALLEAREAALAPLLGRTVGLEELGEEWRRAPLPGTRTLVDPALGPAADR